jgi:hypothetical protein
VSLEAQVQELREEIEKLKDQVPVRQVSNATRLAGERHTHGYATIQSETADSDLTLSGSYQDIDGCSITLEKPGDYVVMAAALFAEVGTTDDGGHGRIGLEVNGTLETMRFSGIFIGEAGHLFEVPGFWHITTTAADTVIKLQAMKSAGSSTSRVEADNTVLMALAKLGRGYKTAPLTSDDHGALSGLADDDHGQYLRTDGTRNLTGNLGVLTGKTIDGVDISAHVADADAHHAEASGGVTDHQQLTNRQSFSAHTQYPLRSFEQFIAAPWIFQTGIQFLETSLPSNPIENSLHLYARENPLEPATTLLLLHIRTN